MNKFVLSHQYKLDLAVDNNRIAFKKEIKDIKTIIVINQNDSIVIYDDFAFRITSDEVNKTTTIHSSKPLYINAKDDVVFLDFE